MLKSLTTGLCLFVACFGTAQSVPDSIWTFSWDGGQNGLLFGNGTDLPSSVKNAIRDDICGVYANIAGSNAVFRANQRADAEFGQLAGEMFLQGNYVCPVGLRDWVFSVQGGTRFLAVQSELRSKYVEKIALTNQYAAAVGALSNFLDSAQNMTTANTTTNSFLQKFWYFTQGRVPVMTDDREMRFSDYIQQWASVYYRYPSLLQFEYGDLEGLVCLYVEVRTVKKADPGKISTTYVAFKDGQWRFLVWDW